MNLQIKRAFRSQALDFWVHRIIMRYPDCTYSGSWIVISWFLHTIFFGWNSFSFHVEFSSQVSFTSCIGLPRISGTLWQPTDPESFLMHTTSMDRAGPLIIMQPSRNLNWLRGTSQLGQVKEITLKNVGNWPWDYGDPTKQQIQSKPRRHSGTLQ